MPKRAGWREPDRHTIAPSARECARRIGMNPRTFADFAKGGVVKPRADGRWDTRVVCAALAEHDAAQTTAEVAGGRKAGDALERLRTANAQKAEIELARMRGELIECATVHAAYGEVVAIVRAGLLAMPKLAAVELANQSAAAVERWCDAWARDLARAFEERCAAVKLIAPSSQPVAEGGGESAKRRGRKPREAKR